MKYTVKPSTKFQKDVKRIQRRGYDISLLTEIIKKLANGETLPEKNKDHNLGGDYAGCRECHITPDWLSMSLRWRSCRITYICSWK